MVDMLMMRSLGEYIEHPAINVCLTEAMLNDGIAKERLECSTSRAINRARDRGSAGRDEGGTE
jgi:hypothetical protein